MTFELIVLALATAVRPTSLAAVCALLASASPRRLMVAYIVAGAAFTVTFGLAVIVIFHGAGVSPGSKRAAAVPEIVGGCVAIVLGLLLLTNRIGTGHDREAPPAPNRWTTVLQQRVTTRTAAVAGPVTHLPGVFYLLALNLIISHQTWLHLGILNLLLYNAVWFCLPIAALAICIVSPDSAESAVRALEAWARAHTRAILIVVSFGVGAALLIDGLQKT